MCIPAFATLGATMTGTTVTAATASQLATIGTLTALQGATAVAQYGLSIKAQKEQAKAQRRQQVRETEAERQRFQREMTANRLAEAQNNIIVAKELQEITRKTDIARGTAQVSAAEACVSGLSVNVLFGELEQQQSEAIFALQQQEQFNASARQLGLEDAQIRSMSNLAQINQPIAQPDYLTGLVNLAGTGLGIYSQNLKLAGDLGMDTFIPEPDPIPEVIIV